MIVHSAKMIESIYPRSFNTKGLLRKIFESVPSVIVKTLYPLHYDIILWYHILFWKISIYVKEFHLLDLLHPNLKYLNVWESCDWVLCQRRLNPSFVSWPLRIFLPFQVQILFWNWRPLLEWIPCIINFPRNLWICT